jgi:2-C-methyl-D-erythritol 4-phosphate cytidylyltransferase
MKPVAVLCWALVPAAGSGSRMGAEVPKQYLSLDGATVIEHSLRRLAAHPAVQGIAVVLAADDPHWRQLRIDLPVPLVTAVGGAERADSVLGGLRRLQALARPGDWVLVHDAARPCLRRSDLDRLLTELADHPVGGLLALPAVDTMKRADAEGNVIRTVSREHLWRAQTPQMFRLGELTRALAAALESRLAITDECSAMELGGARPKVVEGHPDNIKITTPADLELARLYLRQQAREQHPTGG